MVGETDNGPDTLRLSRELRSHIPIMEAHLSGLNVTETTRRIKQELPETGLSRPPLTTRIILSVCWKLVLTVIC